MLNSSRDTRRSGRNPFPSHCVLQALPLQYRPVKTSLPQSYNMYKYHRNIKLGNQILYTMYISIIWPTAVVNRRFWRIIVDGYFRSRARQLCSYRRDVNTLLICKIYNESTASKTT